MAATKEELKRPKNKGNEVIVHVMEVLENKKIVPEAVPVDFAKKVRVLRRRRVNNCCNTVKAEQAG